ncbi:MAG: hypothetical protein RTU63_05920 [Candidatus Thorarchaeota archaeon]
MNEKGKVLAVVGVVLTVCGYVLNEIFMMLIRMNPYVPEVSEPHSGPIMAGTSMLTLIPIGMTFLFIALVLEIIDRNRRIDTTEIWDSKQE